MPNKKNENTQGEKLISLKIDSETQKEMLENPKISSAIQKVFEAVGGLQDRVDEKLENKE